MTPMQQCYQSDDDDDEDDSTRCDASKQGYFRSSGSYRLSALVSGLTVLHGVWGTRQNGEFMIRFSLLFVGLKPNDCESKMSSFTHVNYLFIYFVHKSAPVIYIP